LKKTRIVEMVKVYNYSLYCVDDKQLYVDMACRLMRNGVLIDKGFFPDTYREPFQLLIAEFEGYKMVLDDDWGFSMNASMQLLVRQAQFENEKKGLLLPYRNKLNCQEQVLKRMRKKTKKLLVGIMKRALIQEVCIHTLTHYLFQGNLHDAIAWGPFSLGLSVRFAC
jgi:hypothetical protein